MIESGKVTPNLIVANFQMPEMNGLEMLKRVRTGGVANLPHDVPFIIPNGYLELKPSIPAVRLGVNGLICKPLTPAVAKKSSYRSPPVILRVTFETSLIMPTTKSIAAARLMRKL
jgi:CheY-like chemotaxis protein